MQIHLGLIEKFASIFDIEKKSAGAQKRFLS